MIKALIFDLDNCLAPATQVGEALYQPAFEAIRISNDGTLSNDRLEESFEAVWSNAFDWVADQYRYTPAMRRAGWERFAFLKVSHPMNGYSDLAALEQIEQDCFLVTSGFRRLQESKIDALGIRKRFRATFIDAIDEPERTSKQAIFQRILEDFQIAPDETLVIGDNPHSEIAAGNRLGIQTIQTLRPGIAKSVEACSHIHSLDELVDPLQR